MTCIAAIEHDGRVWIGGDSLVSTSWGFSVIRAEPKVFKSGKELLIGTCDSARVPQILRYHLRPPAPSRGKHDPQTYIVAKLIPEIRKLLRQHGVNKVENRVEEMESQFLLGFRGRLFYVDEDYQVGSPSIGFHAIGAGAEVACGALYSTRKMRFTPRQRILAALTAAQHYVSSVRGPFTVLSVGGEDTKAKKKGKVK